jgi:hypothetical protein
MSTETIKRITSGTWPKLRPLINVNDAHQYLNIDAIFFQEEVESHLSALNMGKQGRSYKRTDLDHWKSQFENDCDKKIQGGTVKWRL